MKKKIKQTQMTLCQLKKSNQILEIEFKALENHRIKLRR